MGALAWKQFALFSPVSAINTPVCTQLRSLLPQPPGNRGGGGGLHGIRVEKQKKIEKCLYFAAHLSFLKGCALQS